MTSYLEHPLLKAGCVEKRLFQLDLAVSALRSSTLVVLPTGLGKTVVALMIILARLDRGKAVFLAPTRPLVEQHASFLMNVLADREMVVQVTGETSPEKREEDFRRARIVVATPQVIENDLLSRKINLSEVSLVIFDEAHRAVGNYAYVYIASRYQKEGKDRLVLGITASPGSQEAKIEEICANLGIDRIETRTEDDPDVAPFVHRRVIEWIKVQVPAEIQRLRRNLEEVMEDRIGDLNALGVAGLVYGELRPADVDVKASKGELLELQKRMASAVASRPNQALFKGLSVMAEVMKLKHAAELADTQGVDALRRYFDRLEGEARSRGGSKATRRLMEDPRVQETLALLADTEIEHPKLAAVKALLQEELERNPDSRIMVFTNYRDTATALLKYLKGSAPIRPVRFVGQASRKDDEGLSQKKQAKVLDGFRSGEHNVLIATSVGEEGIDVPATDMVLFYEPVPSEIRSIQRKGRTGRARAGRVVVLMARGTKDEAYYWISDRKEKSMHRQIRGFTLPQAGLDTPLEVKDSSSPPAPAGQGVVSSARQVQITDLDMGDEEAEEELLLSKTLILVDPRERDMARRLESQGVEVTLRALEVGDYVISDRLGVERKTAEDFVSSLIDPERGLFRQVSDLSRSYEKPLLILEGEDLYTRQVHPNAVRGALASIAVDFGVPVISTADMEETAAFLALLARREQSQGRREVKAHGRKTARTLKEQQEYLISAIPSVGPSVARSLLRHFGSVEEVVTASYEDLMGVEGVGPKIAERIRELVSGEYKG